MDNQFFFVTICYNNLEGLKETVESLVGQAYKNWKGIIVDGGSSDGTKSYLLEVKEKYPKFDIISEPDGGIYDAMNKGISRMPVCDYFCFLNSGDSLFESRTLSLLNEKISGLSDCKPMILYGHTCEQFSPDEAVIKEAGKNIRLEKGMFCHHQSMFFHHAYSDMLHKDYKLSGDYDYIVRAVKKIKDKDDLLLVDMVIARFDMAGVSGSRRMAGIIEDYHLRVENEICSPLMSAVYSVRSFLLMYLKRFSYPLYLLLRTRGMNNLKVDSANN